MGDGVSTDSVFSNRAAAVETARQAWQWWGSLGQDPLNPLATVLYGLSGYHHTTTRPSMAQIDAFLLPEVHLGDYRDAPCLLALRGIVSRARLVLRHSPTLNDKTDSRHRILVCTAPTTCTTMLPDTFPTKTALFGQSLKRMGGR